MRLIDKISNADFRKILTDKGYSYFTKGFYNLNIIGIRATDSKVFNRFCDYIVVDYFTKNGSHVKDIFPITTYPGKYSLEHPSNNNGCAILVPGQYKGAYTIGLHKTKYSALVQIKPVKVYRDNNKNDIYDMSSKTIEEGLFGINIHKAGINSILVDNWSAGCQVFKRNIDFEYFMRLIGLQEKNGLGNKFTYTLITEDDL